MNYKKTDYGCGTAIALILVAIGLAFFMNWIGWLLWGALAVGVFGLPALTYWQFWELLFSFIFSSLAALSQESQILQINGLAAPKFFSRETISSLLIVFEREILR